MLHRIAGPLLEKSNYWKTIARPNTDVTLPGSRARIFVMVTNEDLTIVRQTRMLLEPSMKQPKRMRAAQMNSMSSASLSALSYEHTLSEHAIRLWDDSRHMGD
jgi:hypothetical protein